MTNDSNMPVLWIGQPYGAPDEWTIAVQASHSQEVDEIMSSLGLGATRILERSQVTETAKWVVASGALVTALPQILKVWLHRNDQRKVTIDIDGKRIEHHGGSAKESDTFIAQYAHLLDPSRSQSHPQFGDDEQDVQADEGETDAGRG